MDATSENHYAVLGLDRDCTATQIRDAYRLLAKRHHPDLNPNSAEARARTQALNAAYEILRDPMRRRDYDHALDRASQAKAPGRGAKIERNITKEVRLRIDDFLRGTSIDVQVNDPANPDGPETYRVEIPAMTAPGARLRVPRRGAAAGGFVQLRLKALPGFRFKVRGSDLRTDLRISPRRAEQGGVERLERPTGGMIPLTIPKRVKRGEILRIAGEGMPKPRGGRGDLLVRITYRPGVRVSRVR
ncbi:MAG TPA: DnaJ domain-containing protein [Chthoniobacterales bacterium]